MCAIREALAEAIAQHHTTGSPVYSTDDDGSICEFLPDKKVRKLTHEELKKLTSVERCF